MNVFVCVSMHLRMHVCMNVSMHLCLYVFIIVCMYITRNTKYYNIYYNTHIL